MEALVLGCAFVAACTGIATYHAVGHGGHIEIGPAALAHAHPRPPARKRRTETQRTRTPPSPTSALVAQAPFLRGGTHDPKALLATAKDLQKLHVDVSISEVAMAASFTSSYPDTYLDFWPARIEPVYGPGHHLDGLELLTIPPESPLREAGLAAGDQLLGIDGYDFTDDTYRSVDVLEARKRGWAVLEIARANHHVVLSIHWPVR